MFGIIVTVLAVILLGYFVLKNYYPPIILLLIGLFLLLVAGIMGTDPVTAKQSTHFFGFDLAEAFTRTVQGRLPGLGLNIMAIAGFAFYMDRIGASKSLVRFCVRPLKAIHSPYLLLALTYVVGQFIALFFNSAVGLGLLLMASIYPLLIALGVSRVSAAAVIASTCCLDLGPSSSNSMRAADLCNIDVVSYFVQGQGPIALCTVATVAVGHFFVQKWFDKREKHADDGKADSENFNAEEALKGAGPSYYAILPMLPLFLLVIFSPMVYAKVKLSLVTAIVVSLIISLFIDILTRRDFKLCCKDTQAIFEGMGKVFTSTVSLIVCAEFFALGLSKVGGITTMIQAAASMQNAGLIVMLFVMLLIMIVASVVTGSGNAAFFAFSPLLPEAAASVGIPTLALVVPVQLSAGIARTMSPIAGVIIAVAGISGCTPIQLVRRTIPVMILAMIVSVATSLIFLEA